MCDSVDCTTMLRQFWRRKWYVITALTVLICLFTLIHLAVEPIGEPYAKDLYMDNVDKEVYQDVLRKWYNFSTGVAWYNGKSLEPGSSEYTRYLAEVRQDWIFWNHNTLQGYNLENPELEDPSMGQARVIRNVFKDKKNGFFVECGAYDGETRSNTLVLERFLGWTGLLVEADPINFSKMATKNRRAYLTPTCLSIRSYPSVSSFLMARNVGRLHEPDATDVHLENTADVAHNGVHVSVQCIPFADLMFALNITNVDYFSLDVEGSELHILKTIPFDEINIQTLSVEFSHVEAGKNELIDFMESKGYYVYTYVVREDKLAHDIIFVKYDRDSAANQI